MDETAIVRELMKRARLHVTGTADVRRLLEIIVRGCERDVAQPAPSA